MNDLPFPSRRGRLMLPILALAVLFGFARPAPANLIVNGGFETGNFNGWTHSTLDDNSLGVDPFAPHSGQYAAFFGELDPFTGINVISQTFATTVGQTYTVDYWLMYDESNGTPSEFQVMFGATTLSDLVNPDAFRYQEFSFNVVATSATTTLTFSGFSDFSFFDLDDVSVNPAAAVPEPATLTLAAIGSVLAAGLAGRRRRNAQRA